MLSKDRSWKEKDEFCEFYSCVSWESQVVNIWAKRAEEPSNDDTSVENLNASGVPTSSSTRTQNQKVNLQHRVDKTYIVSKDQLVELVEIPWGCSG